MVSLSIVHDKLGTSPEPHQCELRGSHQLSDVGLQISELFFWDLIIASLHLFLFLFLEHLSFACQVFCISYPLSLCSLISFAFGLCFIFSLIWHNTEKNNECTKEYNMKDLYEIKSCRIPPSPSLFINKSLVHMPSGPFARLCFMYTEVCVQHTCTL